MIYLSKWTITNQKDTEQKRFVDKLWIMPSELRVQFRSVAGRAVDAHVSRTAVQSIDVLCELAAQALGMVQSTVKLFRNGVRLSHNLLVEEDDCRLLVLTVVGNRTRDGVESKSNSPSKEYKGSSPKALLLFPIRQVVCKNCTRSSRRTSKRPHEIAGKHPTVLPWPNLSTTVESRFETDTISFNWTVSPV